MYGHMQHRYLKMSSIILSTLLLTTCVGSWHYCKGPVCIKKPEIGMPDVDLDINLPKCLDFVVHGGVHLDEIHIVCQWKVDI